jgi:hypothetical protein
VKHRATAGSWYNPCMTVLAFAGGSWIFIGVVVLLLVGVIIGYYTYSGSGISPHPAKNTDASPGAREQSSASGKGQSPGGPLGEHSEGGAFDSHGGR